jgi:hypothetical protein
MGIDSHLSTCVGTQSPKYLEMAQGHISLSPPTPRAAHRPAGSRPSRPNGLPRFRRARACWAVAQPLSPPVGPTCRCPSRPCSSPPTPTTPAFLSPRAARPFLPHAHAKPSCARRPAGRSGFAEVSSSSSSPFPSPFPPPFFSVVRGVPQPQRGLDLPLLARRAPCRGAAGVRARPCAGARPRLGLCARRGSASARPWRDATSVTPTRVRLLSLARSAARPWRPGHPAQPPARAVGQPRLGAAHVPAMARPCAWPRHGDAARPRPLILRPAQRAHRGAVPARPPATPARSSAMAAGARPCRPTPPPRSRSAPTRALFAQPWARSGVPGSAYARGFLAPAACSLACAATVRGLVRSLAQPVHPCT